MAKCIPTCIMCAKFGTMKCHKVARIKRIEQIVQGAYPWDCLYNKLDKEGNEHKDGERSECYDRIETYPFGYSHYPEDCSIDGKSCPLKHTSSWSDKHVLEFDRDKKAGECPMMDPDGHGRRCECAIRLIRFTKNEYKLAEHRYDKAINCVHDLWPSITLDEIETHFELDPKWKEKLRSQPIDCIQSYGHESVDIKGSQTFLKYCYDKEFETIGDLLDGFDLDEFRRMIINYKDRRRNTCLSGLSEGFIDRGYNDWDREDAETLNGAIPIITKYHRAIVLEGNRFVIAEPNIEYSFNKYKRDCEESRRRERERRQEELKKHEEQLARRRAKAKEKREAALKAKREAEEKEAVIKEVLEDFLNKKTLLVVRKPVEFNKNIRLNKSGFLLDTISPVYVGDGVCLKSAGTIPCSDQSYGSVVVNCVVGTVFGEKRNASVTMKGSTLVRFIREGVVVQASSEESAAFDTWWRNNMR